MFRVMLCCAAGMSTSLLVKKMVASANDRGIDVQIDAYGATDFDEQFPNYQVVLLGPQVKYMLDSLTKRASVKGIPVKPIEMMDYGMQRGDKVLDFAISVINSNKGS